MEYRKTNYVITIKTSGAKDIKGMYYRHCIGTTNPRTFSTLTIKTTNPKATIIIFSTGNITVMGCDTKWGVFYTLHQLRTLYPELIYTDIKITNVVAKFELPKRDITKVFHDNIQRCICNLDIFPSCSYHVPNTSVKANFFNSGKMILVGCTDDDMIKEIMEKDKNNLNKYFIIGLVVLVVIVISINIVMCII